MPSSGCGGDQVAGVVAIYQAESADLPGSVRPALVGGHGDGDGDQGGQARAGIWAGTGSGTRTARAAVPAGAAARRAVVRGRLVRAAVCGPFGDGAAVTFLQQIQVRLTRRGSVQARPRCSASHGPVTLAGA